MIHTLFIILLTLFSLTSRYNRRKRSRRRNYKRNKSYKRNYKKRYEDDDDDSWILQEDLWDDYDF